MREPSVFPMRAEESKVQTGNWVFPNGFHHHCLEDEQDPSSGSLAGDGAPLGVREWAQMLWHRRGIKQSSPGAEAAKL